MPTCFQDCLLKTIIITSTLILGLECQLGPVFQEVDMCKAGLSHRYATPWEIGTESEAHLHRSGSNGEK